MSRRWWALVAVGFGLVLNAVGLYLFWLLGRDATFASLVPGTPGAETGQATGTAADPELAGTRS